MSLEDFAHNAKSKRFEYFQSDVRKNVLTNSKDRITVSLRSNKKERKIKEKRKKNVTKKDLTVTLYRVCTFSYKIGMNI